MVVGCRTIKCYGWENHYIEKLNAVRERQRKVIVKVNVLNSLGNSFFQNTGLIAIFAILGIQWHRGEILKNDITVSLVAMVYMIFFAMNTLVYFALTNIQNFLGIIFRLS